MDEQEIERQLKELGRKVDIDQEHKKELRKSFEDKNAHPKRNYKKYMVAASIILVIALSTMSLLFSPLERVQADSLKVQNYRTFTRVDSNVDLSVAEYDGILYIPNIQEGIYRMKNDVMEKIYNGKVSMVKVSPGGRSLIFYEEGTIGTIDLASLKSEIILRNEGKTFYDEPSWITENRILITKHTIQDPASSYYNPNHAEILELDLESKEQVKLAYGNYGSYIKSQNALLYQKGDDIAMLNLDNHNETIIDQGSQPAASPDGKVIAYTKLNVSYIGISENVRIENVLQDLWVAEGTDYAMKSKITSNVVLETINQEEWLKNLKPSNELQTLSQSGRYCYLFPTWSSDSKSIYALRRDYSDNSAVVVRADIGKEPISLKTTAERFIQAIMLEDEDYQNALLAADSQTLEDLKKKKIIGYKVLGEGKEQVGEYIDMEITFDANVKSEIGSIRLYLEKQEKQYYVINTKDLK